MAFVVSWQGAGGNKGGGVYKQGGKRGGGLNREG